MSLRPASQKVQTIIPFRTAKQTFKSHLEDNIFTSKDYKVIFVILNKIWVTMVISDLTVFYNSIGSVVVFAPITMKNRVCGLCGLYDMNGENSRELVDASLRPMNSELEFITAWISPSISNPNRVEPGIKEVTCDFNEVCSPL